MNEEEYLKSRLDDQIDWYDRKSIWNQRWYKRLQVAVLIAAAAVPFLSGYMGDGPGWVKMAVGALGLGIAAITAIQGIYGFQESWIKYRTTCESLKKEKYKYMTRVVPYDVEDPFKALVERVEGLISKENTDWSEQIQSAGRRGDA